MSEIITEPDVTVDSSTATDVIADSSPVEPDFDAMFGLEPEPAPEVIADAPEATDPPVPHQEEEVKDAIPGEVPATPESPTEEDSAFKFNDKLDWDNDKVPFREEYKALKNAYLELSNSSVESQFVSEPQEFLKWMEETSPTSFSEIGLQLTTRSAQDNPQAWVDYLLQNNPDLLAEKVTGREGMTLERLQGELSFVLDDDDEAVKEALDRFKGTEQPKTEETPEQKEIREWRAERQQAKYQEVVNEVFSPIENSIDELVSQAGLEIKESEYQGKDFNSLDEDTQFKVAVNELIPVWIDLRVKQDPKLVGMQSRLQDLLAKGDVKSAKALQHQAKIVATNFTGELLTILTNKKAKAKIAETIPPVKEQPKQMVRGAGVGVSVPTGVPTADDWKVTEADLFR